MGSVLAPETDRAGFIRFQESAVLVSDMSGFTSTTRRLGIIHFASLIMLMRQLSLPILHAYEALFIGNEADNLIVVLPSPLAAARAACEIQRVIQDYNRSLPAAKKDFEIVLNGIGLHCGAGVVLEKGTEKLHGQVAKDAYGLGEDVAEDGNVVISADMMEAIASDPFFQRASFSRLNTEDGAEAYVVGGALGPMENLKMAPIDDLRFLPAQVQPLLSRHAPNADLERIDGDIDARCMEQKTVLMFEITDYGETGEERMVSRSACMRTIRPRLLECNGTELEDVLWIFDSPTDALCAALACREQVACDACDV